jgi:hypothetical protein
MSLASRFQKKRAKRVKTDTSPKEASFLPAKIRPNRQIAPKASSRPVVMFERLAATHA